MSDRELLALAAKAAGIDYKHDNWDWKHEDHCAFWSYDDLCTCGARWNPLLDDGDALRLAVKLGMIVLFHPEDVEVIADQHAKEDGGEMVDPWACESWTLKQQDPFAATRRAIVRAAAEIGRAMK